MMYCNYTRELISRFQLNRYVTKEQYLNYLILKVSILSFILVTGRMTYLCIQARADISRGRTPMSQ
jgi:hypothetical protein